MIKRLHFLFALYLINVVGNAQETINLSGYDGSGFTVVVTSTVNDNITIVFEDLNIVENFYTEFQDQIYMYGGLDTMDGPFQGAPDFNDYLNSHPVLTLVDSDNAVQPNTYSVTINLTDIYTTVPDGTMVFGYNLLFQNQFGGLGQPNNQTDNLYIDLTDAIKDSTLSLNNVNQLEPTVKFFDNRLYISNYAAQSVSIKMYDLLGKLIYENANLSILNSFSQKINTNYKGIKVVVVEFDGYRKVIKAVN